jgi:hypothetical protein
VYAVVVELADVLDDGARVRHTWSAMSSVLELSTKLFATAFS